MGIMIMPETSEQLVHCYLFWMLVFFVINILWDIRSPHTPPFHIHRFSEKANLIVGATSFCSSALLLGSVLNKATSIVVGATPVPLLIGAGLGLILSLSSLCPYPAAEPNRMVPNFRPKGPEQ